MSERILNPDEQKLWEDARGWAAAEILAKYYKEFQQAHEKQFSRLTKRAADLAVCTCKTPALHTQGYCGYCGLPIPPSR